MNAIDLAICDHLEAYERELAKLAKSSAEARRVIDISGSGCNALYLPNENSLSKLSQILCEVESLAQVARDRRERERR